MNFASDNAYGVWPEILAAMGEAAAGSARSYGDDEITARVRARFGELFERPVAVFPVISGTAANALALATLVPAHGAIFCHSESHIAVDECGAPEFYTHGAKLVGLQGTDGKIAPAVIEQALGHFLKGFVHHVQPAAVSITQSTELGTVYTPQEVSAISNLVRRHGMKLHMDGARFANALAYVGCAPAELSWKAGVDVLSFGATKNGVLAAEAVVFFNAELARDFAFRSKRGGHLLSKMRLLSAQLDAYLTDGLWLDNARHANAMARRLVAGLTALKGTQLMYPVDANEIFVVMPAPMHDALQTGGAKYHPWPSDRPGERAFRLVTAFDTDPADVDRFLSIAKSA